MRTPAFASRYRRGDEHAQRVLAAVIERGRSGRGVYLEVSLLDTALGYDLYGAKLLAKTSVNPRPMGTAHPSMVPYQAFEAQDSAIMLGRATTRSVWFCAVAGLGLGGARTFATTPLRVASHAKVVATSPARD